MFQCYRRFLNVLLFISLFFLVLFPDLECVKLLNRIGWKFLQLQRMFCIFLFVDFVCLSIHYEGNSPVIPVLLLHSKSNTRSLANCLFNYFSDVSIDCERMCKQACQFFSVYVHFRS
ncbi:hypothetical protein S83_065307 [Arachis hypogaea]